MGSQGRNCALTLKESQGHVIELLDGQKVSDGEELGEGPRGTFRQDVSDWRENSCGCVERGLIDVRFLIFSSILRAGS